jgi:hypothetical protein
MLGRSSTKSRSHLINHLGFGPRIGVRGRRLRRCDASSLELDDTFPCIASFSLLVLRPAISVVLAFLKYVLSTSPEQEDGIHPPMDSFESKDSPDAASLGLGLRLQPAQAEAEQSTPAWNRCVLLSRSLGPTEGFMRCLLDSPL